MGTSRLCLHRGCVHCDLQTDRGSGKVKFIDSLIQEHGWMGVTKQGYHKTMGAWGHGTMGAWEHESMRV